MTIGPRCWIPAIHRRSINRIRVDLILQRLRGEQSCSGRNHCCFLDIEQRGSIHVDDLWRSQGRIECFLQSLFHFGIVMLSINDTCIADLVKDSYLMDQAVFEEFFGDAIRCLIRFDLRSHITLQSALKFHTDEQLQSKRRRKVFIIDETRSVMRVLYHV